MRRSRRPTRLAALLSLGLLLQAACTTWAPVALTPSPGGTDSLPAEVRVTRKKGPQVWLLQPFLRGDSVIGLASRTAPLRAPQAMVTGDTSHAAEPGDTIGVALADIRAVHRQKPSPGGIVAAVLGGVAVVALLVALLDMELGAGFGGSGFGF